MIALKIRISLWTILLLLILISAAYVEEIHDPPEYKDFCSMQSSPNKEMSDSDRRDFSLDLIKPMNCLSSYCADIENIDDKNISMIIPKE
ncbi:MAG: hypothetical protein SWO11_13495 [Thermodesulfobacteriota bacterium]|nr:hypothetical protein [Thermodesulfobacteriota bacterium]